MLEIKSKAPNFSLENQNSELVSLSDFLGKKVVIYFYPKDSTPGCTRQACAFRDLHDEFTKKNVIVIGISKDTTKSHMNFINKHDLPFILLSDPDLKAIEPYGVWQEKKNYGKVYMGIVRSTYIIDENGYVEKVFPKANPDTNAQEILDYLG